MEVEAATLSEFTLPDPPHAAVLAHTDQQQPRLYWDRSHYSSPAEQLEAVAKSTTLYVGNLSFSTRTTQIRSHFAKLGPIRRVVLGLDRNKKTPCGFCFVEYMNRSSAAAAVSELSGTKLDGRVIRVELDAGFQSGRQYGRGVKGGQVRDDRSSSTRHNNNKRSAPRMDAALPSGRNEDHMDMEPSAKRQRRD